MEMSDRVACHRLLIIYFDLESKIFDHPPDFGCGGAWGAQIAVQESHGFFATTLPFFHT